jgi:hypothetical protein
MSSSFDPKDPYEIPSIPKWKDFSKFTQPTPNDTLNETVGDRFFDQVHETDAVPETNKENDFVKMTGQALAAKDRQENGGVNPLTAPYSKSEGKPLRRISATRATQHLAARRRSASVNAQQSQSTVSSAPQAVAKPNGLPPAKPLAASASSTTGAAPTKSGIVPPKRTSMITSAAGSQSLLARRRSASANNRVPAPPQSYGLRSRVSQAMAKPSGLPPAKPLAASKVKAPTTSGIVPQKRTSIASNASGSQSTLVRRRSASANRPQAPVQTYGLRSRVSQAMAKPNGLPPAKPLAASNSVKAPTTSGIVPQKRTSVASSTGGSQSVFERLSKPKHINVRRSMAGPSSVSETPKSQQKPVAAKRLEKKAEADNANEDEQEQAKEE